MINFIAMCLATLFIGLMGIISILNFSSYTKANTSIKLSGFLNIASLIILVITLLSFHSQIYLVETALLLVIWFAAVLHGYGQGKIHWSHHLVRFLVIIFLISMMFEPWI